MPSYIRYISALKKICKLKNFELEKIGEIGKRKKYPLYKIVINPNFSKTVCFSSGIHGDEKMAPAAILKFLRNLNPEKFRFKIIILPIANPFGYDNNLREGYLGRKINRLFSKKRLSNENRILYNAIKDEHVFFFHALHEDYEENKFYMYLFGSSKEKIYREIKSLAEKHFEIDNSPIIEDSPAKRGFIINLHDGSFEDLMSRKARYSICTEAPGRQSAKKQIKLDLALMNKILNFVNK